MSVTLLIAYIDCTLWMYLLLAYGRFWQTDCLEDFQTPSPTQWPDICVVIPARNEADIIGNTIPTILQNDYPGSLRMVLVDDRSEDNTSEVMQRIARELDASERVTVVKAPPSQVGWKGKVWAMQCGLNEIAGNNNPPDYVLFTDADIAYEKRIISQLVAKAESGKCVLTSLMVRLSCKSFAERFLIPPFVYFFQLLYPFDWVNNPKRKTAAAAGGCMLIRYDMLMQAGGVESIRTALIDDCALGRLLKPYGPIWLGLTQRVHSMRSYPHIKTIRAMIARSAYDQLDYSLFNLIAALFGLTIMYLLPVLLALFGAGFTKILGIASWICMSITFIPMLRFYKRAPLLSITLPLIATLYMGFTLDSAIQYWRGKGGMWKGRVQATGTHSA